MNTSKIYGQMESGYLVDMAEFPNAIVTKFFVFTAGKFILVPSLTHALITD